MKATRRDFLKIGVATGAALTVSEYLLSGSQMFEPLLVARGQPREVGAIEELVPTTCWIGKQDCGMLARKVNGRIVKLEGHPAHPRNRGTLCPKGQAQIMAFYDPYRVKAPLKTVNEKGVPGEWVETSWEEALTLVGEKIKELRLRDPRLLVWQKGRSKAGHSMMKHS